LTRDQILLNYMHIVTALCLVGVLVLHIYATKVVEITETPEVFRGLVSRLLPDHVDLFNAAIIDNPPPKSGYFDVFELETIDNNNSSAFNFSIHIRGNNAVSLASGLNHYLKYYANCQVSWGADQLNMPQPPPRVPKLRILTQHKVSMK
jgi:alpha-N-acetylglucosaminidase